MKKINALLWGAALMALAIMLGAFGAHGLKSRVSALALETYQTGVLYHIIHSLALLVIGVVELIKPNYDFKFSKLAFLSAIFLFSVNCYLYAVTGVKTFAMVVPIGGVMFILGWIKLAWEARKLNV